MQFIISTTDEVLIPQAGLGLVGALLQDTKLRQHIDAIDVEGYRRPEVKHGDVVTAAIGLLCLGKSDFNDIETFRSDEFFRRSLGLRQIPSEPTLRQRLDAGNDDFENIKVCRKHKADWIIKRNLRKESLEDWLEEAQAFGGWEFPREGKEVYTGETRRERDGKLYRVVFEVTQRTIAADGQKLLVPEIEVNTWWTSLKLSAKEVMALYHAHGTSEQYHSEIKTDLDLERLPSGKFATNATMLSLGLVAYNVLRLANRQEWIGCLWKDSDSGVKCC